MSFKCCCPFFSADVTFLRVLDPRCAIARCANVLVKVNNAGNKKNVDNFGDGNELLSYDCAPPVI